MPVEHPTADYSNTEDPIAAHRPPPEDPARLSVRLLHVASVHLVLRPPADPPMRVDPEVEDCDPDALSPEEFRFRMVRWISTWLGQPERCARQACRRMKACRGDPPTCWRDEPPPSEDEIAAAKANLADALAQALARMPPEG